MSRKCKTTSYDTEDVYEAELLAFAEAQGNYSRYIKRLVARDKEDKERGYMRVSAQPPTVSDVSAEDIEAVDGFV